MPGMVVFGRRWGIASDDLVLPGAFELFLRIVWWIGTLILYTLHKGSFDCHGGGVLHSYLVVLLVVLALIILSLCAIVYVSAQGTITNPGPRRSIPVLVYVRAMLYLPEVVWACLGAIWVSDDSQGCDPAMVGAVIAAVLPAPEPLGVRDMESSEGSQFLSTARSVAAKDTDLVPSDIAAGLALLHQEQDKIDHHRDADDVLEVDLEVELEKAAHCMQFAAAAYGWPMYIYSNPLTGLCKLSGDCCRSQVAEYDLVGGDHLGCHFSSVLLSTGLGYRDFIYVSFHNQIYEIPFFVALDHKREAILVAVRGTLSLKDVLTDLSADCENLPVDGVFGTTYAHKGISQAARYIYRKLVNDGILNQAFSIAPEYKLVITGHSLGAGTASLLAILLRNSFPTLQCYAFSPPGGLVSKALADYSKDFVVSVVLGKDLVPRLSIPNMEDLKRRILKIVSNCNKPKYRILLLGCWYEVFGGEPDDMPTELDQRLEEELSQPLLGEESLMVRHASSSYQSLASDDSPGHAATHLPLFLPGRVRYRAEWSSSDTSFRSILNQPPDAGRPHARHRAPRPAQPHHRAALLPVPMPGMVVFGRRWGIASDDLVLPGAFELFLRIVWYGSFDCHGGGVLHSYLVVLLVVLALIILSLCAIVYVSAQGTITNPGPRRSIPVLVYVRAMLYLPEVVWACLGAIWVSDDSQGCDPAMVGAVIAAVLPAPEPLGVRDMESSEGSQFLSTARSVAAKDTDLVPSDIAAGLALLHQEQDKIDHHRDADDVLEVDLEVELEKAAHCMQFAAAAYGWPMYIYSNPLTGLCKLSGDCCRSQVAEYDLVGGDHLGCHFSSVLLSTGLGYRDFIYVSFHNQIYEIPFFVALDHKREAILVAVRGTLSLKDVLTDLSADCENLPVDGVFGTTYAHKGISQAARYIYRKLVNDGILNQAFSIAPEYKLVITGHSLGAGTASLLAILLRNSFPTLQCYAFSPPGGLVSKALADYSKDFVVSVVLGKDLVPRLSIPNMEDLKRRILKIVSNCNKPKYRILLLGCWYEVFGGEPDDMPTELDQRLEEELSQPLLGEESLMVRHASSSYQSLASDDSPGHAATHLPLFLPGRVRYRAEWSSSDTSFRSILISPRMLADHMPDIVLHALRSLTTERPFSLCPSSSSLGNNHPNVI
ncbi:hypothetical protein CRUP_021353 [Coryphaenoides rupestris]|nr:hypothetical protein CRUP_021353 [Coryphaenoides rupestris]